MCSLGTQTAAHTKAHAPPHTPAHDPCARVHSDSSPPTHAVRIRASREALAVTTGAARKFRHLAGRHSVPWGCTTAANSPTRPLSATTGCSTWNITRTPRCPPYTHRSWRTADGTRSPIPHVPVPCAYCMRIDHAHAPPNPHTRTRAGEQRHRSPPSYGSPATCSNRPQPRANLHGERNVAPPCQGTDHRGRTRDRIERA